MSRHLEKRIAGTLSGNATSAELAALVAETESAIIKADRAAEVERGRAYDPALTPDPRAARQALEDAIFSANRLRTSLPRLQVKHQQQFAAEEHAFWEAEYETIKAKVEEAARKWDNYPTLVATLIDILDTAAIEKEVPRINGSAPDGEQRRLRSVELTARGLDGFSADTPSITKAVQLPMFERSDHMAWPPPKLSLAAEFAVATMQPQGDSRRYTSDWAAATASNGKNYIETVWGRGYVLRELSENAVKISA
jgi:hypothetical protein